MNSFFNRKLGSASGPDVSSRPSAHRPRPKRRRGAALVAGLAIVLGLIAGAAYLWYPWGGAPDQYVTAAAERGDIEDSTTALGTLQPRDFVDVGTQVSGQLRKIHVEIGNSVKQGDLLAEIDPTVYESRVEADRAQLMNLKAQLADKQSQLVLANQLFQRQANLKKATATSEEAYQSSEAVLRSANAQVEAVKAQIRQTESTLAGDVANLGYTKIYAPMAGTVASQIAKQGQTLNANQQAPIIMRIADLSTMTVWTQVSEADVSRLALGMDAYFTTLGQPDHRWHGTLRQILPTPEVLNNVVLYNALFDVPNPKGELMTQMSTQVFFVSAATKNALLVPIAALKPVGKGGRGGRRGGDGGERPAKSEGERPAKSEGAETGRAHYAVQVLTDDGTIEQRRVTVGITNRISAEILKGLEAGERVVVGTRQAGAKRATPSQTPAAYRPRLN
ncbi:MAG: efflux RND transporter periplasmic adaptor subunit [Rhodospirillales bacterium]|nr:efflux RND transporter periplasmic adaptor subunit [Rhodospirillales bacterium]